MLGPLFNPFAEAPPIPPVVPPADTGGSRSMSVTRYFTRERVAQQAVGGAILTIFAMGTPRQPLTALAWAGFRLYSPSRAVSVGVAVGEARNALLGRGIPDVDIDWDQVDISALVAAARSVVR